MSQSSAHSHTLQSASGLPTMQCNVFQVKVICSAEAPPNQLFVANVDDVNVFDMDANRALMDDLGIHAVSGIFFSFLSVHSLSPPDDCMVFSGKERSSAVRSMEHIRYVCIAIMVFL